MMKVHHFSIIIFYLLIVPSEEILANEDELYIESQEAILSKIPFSLNVNLPDSFVGRTFTVDGVDEISKSVVVTTSSFEVDNLVISTPGRYEIIAEVSDFTEKVSIRVIPRWLSILPPLVAIILALVTKEMLLSLFAGIWVGVSIICGYNPVSGLFTSLDTYLVNSLSNQSHASIVIFTLLFGGMIGILSKNGGMLGIAFAASKRAGSRRSGHIITALMGIIIFFDDYANTLLVGNTMRPFTDRLKISREKLSYIVDSTAAPVASLAFISTWSVFQMSLLEVPYANAGVAVSPYITFLKSIPYGFYSIFAIWMLFWLGIMKRDYGPMLKAEVRATKENKVLRDGASPLMDDSLLQKDEFGEKESHWLNAIIPIVVVIITTGIGLYITGNRNLGDMERNFQNIIGSSNSYASLMWAAAMGCCVAALLSICQGILSLKRVINAWLSGIRSMVLAIVILVLAWTLGQVCEDIRTAEFVIHSVEGFISPGFLPILTFVTAAVISFSTGTSWGTMAILVPLVVPLALNMTAGNVDSQIFLASFAAILSGAVFGDHCSPLSDTTILSSMASGSDHIDHVKTQAPYALSVALFAAVFGYLPSGFGVNNFVTMIPTLFLMILFIRIVGKKSEP